LDRAVIPAQTRDVQIDYTAMSFVLPQRVHFRYRLEGRDTTWQEAGTRRQAFYSDLPPGSYTFRVIASNNDGLWNDEGAVVSFAVAPAWFQTGWFRLLSVGLVLSLLVMAYRLRLRQLQRQFDATLEARVGERTRIARELHDTLLQTVQGSRMVADLALREPSDHSRMTRAMEKLAGWLGQATEEGRAALHSLRETAGAAHDLGGALRLAVDECRQGSTADISLAVEGDARPVHPVVSDEVYRIGYEALRNACTHSGGDRLEISLEYGHDLTLRVSDNGVGVDAATIERGKSGHFGLQGMRERAERIGARLTLVGEPGARTTVTVVVPGRIAFR
jgi:signal transduction histidine kinase